MATAGQEDRSDGEAPRVGSPSAIDGSPPPDVGPGVEPGVGRSRRAFLLASAIVLGSALYGASTIPFWFDMNDDAAMLGISMGLFGDGVGDPRLIYQSAFLGAVIGALFRVAPGFDWYSALQCAVLLAGFWTMAHVLLRRDSRPLALASVLVATSAFLPPLLFNLQFTQTSFVCLMTGLVLRIDAMRRESLRGPLLASALGWMLLAALFRPASLMAGQVLLVGITLLAIGDRLLDRDREGALRDLAVSTGLVIGLTLLATGLQSLEGRLFYGDPAWNAFWTHLGDRPYVLENWPRWIGLPRIVTALHQELGITPEQYLLMASWFPISEELYSVDRFREMARVIDGIEVAGDARISPLRGLLAAGRDFFVSTPLFRYGVGLIGLACALPALLDPARRGRSIVLAVVWMALPCLLWLAITVAYRPPPARVWMPLLALSLWCGLACRTVLAPPASETDLARPGVDRRGLVALAILGLGLVGPFPVHAEFRRVVQILSSRRARDCEVSRQHVEVFQRVPTDARIYLAPRVVHADCTLRPFHLDYPEVLVDRGVEFGWRNLTPWVREELFAEQSDLFDVICADPDNMFVVHPQTLPKVERYLQRHRPDVALQPYASDLPGHILSCALPGDGPASAPARAETAPGPGPPAEAAAPARAISRDASRATGDPGGSRAG